MGWRNLYKGETSAKEKQNPDSIYCPENKYGYHINISHPVAAYFMKQYRDEIKAGNFPLSDTERHEFELRFLNWIAKNNLEIGNEGTLPEVTMQDGKPVIDHEKRDARINAIVAEEGVYKQRPTFEIPDHVKQNARSPVKE